MAKLAHGSLWCVVMLVALYACRSSERRSEGDSNPKHASPSVLRASKTELSQTAEQILDESERIARQLNSTPMEKAHYFVELCRVSVESRSPHSEERCLEAIRFAAAAANGNCEGEELQAKATGLLSEVDPERAFDLLNQIPPRCKKLGDTPTRR